MMKMIALLLVLSQLAFGQDEQFPAVSSENLEAIEDAIGNKEDLEVTNSAGLRLLGHAVYIGNVPVVEALLNRIRALGTEDDLRRIVNPTDRTDTRSPLYLAVVLNRPGMLSAFINAGANVNYLFNVGTGPFRLLNLARSMGLGQIEAILARAGGERDSRPGTALLRPRPMLQHTRPTSATARLL